MIFTWGSKMIDLQRAVAHMAIILSAAVIAPPSSLLLAQTDPSKVETVSSQVTPWKPIGQSMGALLNQGYHIVSHAFGFEWGNVSSLEFAASVLEKPEYSFVLTNGKDTVICFVTGPSP